MTKDNIKVPRPTKKKYNACQPALYKIQSGVVAGSKASIMFPKINENDGKAAPFIKAAKAPINISNFSVHVAYWNKRKKPTF